MSPVSNISTVKFAFVVAALLSLVAVGIAIRGTADVQSLGMADDYATRHTVQAAAVELTTADDFGTRNQAAAVELTTADDFGTRNQAAAVELTTADDFGTRHSVRATDLGLNDDYATRQAR
jgi:hypothetical protein